MRYFETWSATPIQPPVGAVSDDQYQKIIDKNLKSGNGDITLIKSPIKRTRRRKEND
jgi:hypothetical protein